MEGYLSLKDHVYNYISERINAGELRPGDKVNEIQVSEQLHISRTPVREALMQLASDGYLDNLPRKGFRVKNLDIATVRQLYEIIGTLDGRAACLCVDVITEEHLAKMQFLAQAMDAAINAGLGDKYYELQVEFHDIYLKCCPNLDLRAAYAAKGNQCGSSYGIRKPRGIIRSCPAGKYSADFPVEIRQPFMMRHIIGCYSLRRWNIPFSP